MKTIGILYICTGPYYLFWEDFYNSFEKKFLPDFKKRYFVFTDAKNIYKENADNVELYNLQPQPWPLVTLLRFSTFLSIEDKLRECDYLMFSNANIVCEQLIRAEELLPRIEQGENLFVTSHPGYFQKHKVNVPYERRQCSLAYIPWNEGVNYVIGAFFGGTTNAFIEMSKTLKKNIEEDLKHNVIAKWHDESHLNRYIINKPGVRVLSPEYCYPVGMSVDYEKKITGVSKQAKFDVRTFKGVYDAKKSLFSIYCTKLQSYLKMACNYSLFLRDMLLRKKLEEI